MEEGAASGGLGVLAIGDDAVVERAIDPEDRMTGKIQTREFISIDVCSL